MAWSDHLRKGEREKAARACRAADRRLGGLCHLICRSICQGRQILVGLRLFLQRLIEQLHDVLLAKDLSPALQRAVAGDLVVLDSLGGRDQTGIKSRGALELFHDLFALVEDAFNRGAGLALSALAEDLENLLEALDLAFRLVLVLLEGRLQLVTG